MAGTCKEQDTKTVKNVWTAQKCKDPEPER